MGDGETYRAFCPSCGQAFTLGDTSEDICTICRQIDDEESASPAQEQFRSSRSKNQRKRLMGPPHKTTKKPIAQLAAFGEVRQCAAFHWQLRTSYGAVDWWPHKGKWRFPDQETQAGSFKDMLAELEAKRG